MGELNADKRMKQRRRQDSLQKVEGHDPQHPQIPCFLGFLTKHRRFAFQKLFFFMANLLGNIKFAKSPVFWPFFGAKFAKTLPKAPESSVCTEDFVGKHQNDETFQNIWKNFPKTAIFDTVFILAEFFQSAQTLSTSYLKSSKRTGEFF